MAQRGVFLRKTSEAFFLAVLFPFVAIAPIGVDTQPYAVALSFVILSAILARGEFALPRRLWILVIPAIYALILFFVSRGPALGALRSVIGYVSVFSISAATYRVGTYLNPKLFLFASWVWFLFGVIQAIVNKSFGSPLLSRMVTTADRGVTSLAPEPSLYAVCCFFFLLYNEYYYSYRRYSSWRYGLVVVQAMLGIFLSGAALGVALALAFLMAKGTVGLVSLKGRKSRSMAALVLGVGVLLGWLFVQGDYTGGTRARSLLELFIQDPVLILDDESVADHIGHVVLAHYAFIQSGGVGFGLATWRDDGPRLAKEAGGWLAEASERMVTFGDRIISGWGAALFELGFIGLLMILAVSVVILYAAMADKRRRYLYLMFTVLTYVVMVWGVPLALPLFSCFIGLCARTNFGEVQGRPVIYGTSHERATA